MSQNPTDDKVPADHVEHLDGEGEGAGVGGKGRDLGAEFYENYTGERRQITAEDNKRVLRKVDWHLLPIVCYIYWAQQYDKAALSYASVWDLNEGAHLVGKQYSWLSSIVYFAQLVFQPLSVYALVVFPVNYWIAGCFFTWGSLLCIMSAMKSFAGLMVFRFFLGAAEASIAPSMMIVTSMWWTRREQPLRNNIWYSMNGMSQIIGSLISWGLGHAKTTKLYKYQLILLVPGLISVSLATLTFFIFPRHPAMTRWLSEDDKYVALERIRLNNTGTQTTKFKWKQVREAFMDPKAIIFMLLVFLISMVSGGISAFGPIILQGFGLSPFQTILYNMIPGAISIGSNIITALCIQYTKRKAPVLFIASLFPLAGAAALYRMPHTPELKSPLLAVYFILNVYQCITPIVYSWTFANTAGHTKKATMTGLLYVGLCVGNIVGPQLYKPNEKPKYTTGLQANLVCLAILSGLILCQAAYLQYLNKRNIARRRAKGKTGVVLDYSLESASQWDHIRDDQQAKDAAEGHAEVHNTQAFLDLTDKENEDFIYSL